MSYFDLVEQPVFPVDGPRGRERLGIFDVLEGAHELDLAFADPLQEAASLRFLLAIALDACGLPGDDDEWADRWDAGHFDPDVVSEYLNRYRDRFDLLGQQPAWQVADLHTPKDETKPSSLLVPSASTGNNVPLFSARTEANPPALGLADAALAVLAVHAWDTAAIKTGAVGDPNVKGGKTTGNHTGPLGQLGVVIPVGETLFQTLMLNTPTARSMDSPGTPWWRREPETAEWRIREPDGLLDLLTWQARRIRLFPETSNSGETVVRQVLVCAGDRLASVPDVLEIHTAWRVNDKQKAGEPARRPLRHRSGRALWRGLSGLLAVQQSHSAEGLQTSVLLEQLGRLDDVIPGDFPLGIFAVGIEYGNQSAVVENVYSDQMPLPTRALGSDTAAAGLLRDIAEDAEELRRALNNLADNVRRATGGDGIPWDKGQRPGDQMMYEFDALVRRILAGIQRSVGQEYDARVAWQREALTIARRAAEPVVTSAASNGFLGRGEKKNFISVPLAENFYQGKIRKILSLETDERKSA